MDTETANTTIANAIASLRTSGSSLKFGATGTGKLSTDMGLNNIYLGQLT